MDIEHLPWRTFCIRMVELVVVVNIVLLNVLAFRSFQSYQGATTATQTQKQASAPEPSIAPTMTTMPTPVIQTTTITQVAGAKEFYIPLGTGSTTSSDWENIPGVLAYIDSSKYTASKTVTFEASITVPTANETVWIQLYNMTDEHPVWYSQMSMNSESQFIVSPPITLDPGNKLYQVQMKTQLQYPATLDQARVHIVLQ